MSTLFQRAGAKLTNAKIRRKQRSKLAKLRALLNEGKPLGLRAALAEVMADKPWGTNPDGSAFAHFAVSPRGFAANTQEKGELLVEELLNLKFYEECGDYLSFVARGVGRKPIKNDSNGANIGFFKIKR